MYVYNIKVKVYCVMMSINAVPHSACAGHCNADLYSTQRALHVHMNVLTIGRQLLDLDVTYGLQLHTMLQYR